MKQSSQLSLSGHSHSNDTFKIDMLRNKLLKNRKINKGVEYCEVTLGQLRCYSDLLYENSNIDKIRVKLILTMMTFDTKLIVSFETAINISIDKSTLSVKN